MLSTLTEDQLLRVAQIVEEIPVPAGKQICRVGETGNSLYIITEGAVRKTNPSESFKFPLSSSLLPIRPIKQALLSIFMSLTPGRPANSQRLGVGEMVRWLSRPASLLS